MPMSPSSFVPSVNPAGGDGAVAQAPGVRPENNYAAQQIEQMGQAVAQAGGAAFRTGQSMTRMVNDTIDDANVKSAETQMLTNAMDVTRGYLVTKGKAATDGYDAATQALAKAKQDAAAGLTNPIQQRMYNVVAQQHLASFGAQMYEHNHQQTNAYAVSAAQKRMETAGLLALQASDHRYDLDSEGKFTGDFYTATGVMEQEAQNAARLSGFSGKDPVTGKMDPQTEAMVREAWTNLNHAMISKMLDNHDAAGADQWFREQSAAGHMEMRESEQLGSVIKQEKDRQYYEDAGKGYLARAQTGAANAPATFAPIATGAPINPTSPAVTDRPGTDRGDHIHNGYDIKMPVGTDLLAPTAGTVSKVWNDEVHGGGLSVEVTLPDGRTVGMAHLSVQSVKEGQQVQQGTVLGKSGDTGNATGPSVHYMLRNKDGSIGDPFAASQPQPNPAGIADPEVFQKANELNQNSNDDPYTKKQIERYMWKEHSETRAVQDQTYEEDVKQPAVQALYASGGNYNAIPASIRSKLKPEDAFKLANFEMPIRDDLPTVSSFIIHPETVTIPNVQTAFTDGKLSRGAYTQWLERAMTYKNAPDKLLEASVDSNDIKVFAADNGYTKAALGDEYEPKMAYLTYQVEHDILTKEQSTGKKLDTFAKDEIIKLNLAKIATVTTRPWYQPHWLFGSNFKVTPDSQFTFEGRTPEGIEKIPDDVRAEIIAEAKKHGVDNPSEDDIRLRYAQLQATKP